MPIPTMNQIWYPKNRGHILFFKYNKKGDISIIVIYVDDITMRSNDSQEIRMLTKRICTVVETT